MCINTMKPTHSAALVLIPLLAQGCAVLTSNPYYKPSTAAAVDGHADGGGAVYVRFGGQNLIVTKGKAVDVGVKSIGSMHGYVPMAMGPLLPIIPTFLTAPDKAHPTVHLELYLRPKAGNYVFNPMTVRIVNTRGDEFAPVSYSEPVQAGSGAFPWYPTKNALRESKEIALAKDELSCFVLQFDMTPSPDWNLVMRVNGLRADSYDVPAEEFKFERGSAVYVIWGGREYFCSG